MLVDHHIAWRQNGAVKRLNIRDVPDDVYEVLVAAAEANRQSLSAFVVNRLVEVADVARLDEYVSSYQPPVGSGVSLDDAVAAVRAVRDAS